MGIERQHQEADGSGHHVAEAVNSAVANGGPDFLIDGSLRRIDDHLGSWFLLFPDAGQFPATRNTFQWADQWSKCTTGPQARRAASTCLAGKKQAEAIRRRRRKWLGNI